MFKRLNFEGYFNIPTKKDCDLINTQKKVNILSKKMDLRGVFVMVVLIGCFGGSFANVVFEVQHKFGGGINRSLSAFKAHDSDRHRRILAAADLPLGGNGQPTDVALYFTKIAIGTPAKDYHVQVDTGSDTLWVNCAGCEKCPKKSDIGIELELYDMKASSTGKPITCDEDLCTTMFGAPYTDCKVGMPCSYSVTYGDGSSTSGNFVRDNVQLNRVSGNFQMASMSGNIAFGCGAKQSGQLGTSTDQALDGIIGFGQANSSMISQLASAGKVKRTFSHCLDGKNGGGIFAIGEVVHPKFKTTPMVPHEAHYNVIMKEIEVGGDVLKLPTSIFDTGARRGTIIDSGTTLAYFPDEVFDPLMKKILQPNMPARIMDKQFTCVKYSGDVDDAFPVVTFHFEDSLSMKVYPHEYLFEVEDDEWCIGFQNSGLQSKDGKEITLLGDLVLSNKLVMYDLDNQTIGWIEYNCSSSIQVKDDQSGNVYSVGAHDLTSLSSNINAWKILTVLSLIASIFNLI